MLNAILYIWLRIDISFDGAITMARSIQRGINLVCTAHSLC